MRSLEWSCEYAEGLSSSVVSEAWLHEKRLSSGAGRQPQACWSGVTGSGKLISEAWSSKADVGISGIANVLLAEKQVSPLADRGRSGRYLDTNLHRALLMRCKSARCKSIDTSTGLVDDVELPELPCPSNTSSDPSRISRTVSSTSSSLSEIAFKACRSCNSFAWSGSCAFVLATLSRSAFVTASEAAGCFWGTLSSSCVTPSKLSLL